MSTIFLEGKNYNSLSCGDVKRSNREFLGLSIFEFLQARGLKLLIHPWLGRNIFWNHPITQV